MKLRKVCDVILAERGPLSLFALLMIEGEVDAWDLVVSAAWAKPFDKPSLDFIYGAMARVLTRSEMTQVSRVVVADPASPIVANVTRAMNVSGLVQISNVTLFGQPIRAGVFFEAHPPSLPGATTRVRKQRKRTT